MRALGGLGYPAVHPTAGVWRALGCEIICTFTLVFMVFATAVDKRATKFVYAMCIGGSLGAAVLAIGPISGAALNPNRWFGPALFGKLLSECNYPELSHQDGVICLVRILYYNSIEKIRRSRTLVGLPCRAIGWWSFGSDYV